MAAHKPSRCVILQRPMERASLVPGRDVDWEEAVAAASPVECVPVAATDPLYILYTSGTTGIPKGVVRDNGGHAVALKWSMGAVYGMGAGEVYWAASDIGWVVGHSYIVYAPLLKGCTTILYEGKPVGTPDPGAFWRVTAQHGVNVLFTAPTAFRAIKKEDPTGSHIARHDLSRFRALFLAGERCDPDTLRWAETRLGVPVIDHWWQTETGCLAPANCVGLGMLPVKPGSPTKPVPGYDIRVVDEAHHEVPAGQIGTITIKLPLPPGCLPTLWKNDDGFVRSYLTAHPGHYLTGDAGYEDEDGYLYVMSRVDDIINVAGHRLSTGQMEEVLSSHQDVAECAVVGVLDEIKGEVPVGFVVTKAGVARPRDVVRPHRRLRPRGAIARHRARSRGRVRRGPVLGDRGRDRDALRARRKRARPRAGVVLGRRPRRRAARRLGRLVRRRPALRGWARVPPLPPARRRRPPLRHRARARKLRRPGRRRRNPLRDARGVPLRRNPRAGGAGNARGRGVRPRPRRVPALPPRARPQSPDAGRRARLGGLRREPVDAAPSRGDEGDRRALGIDHRHRFHAAQSGPLEPGDRERRVRRRRSDDP